METFGELLKWFRLRAGLEQKPLADLLGVHRNTIVAWENSQYLPRHSDMVEDLAKELYLSEAETNQLLAAAHYPPKYHLPHNAVFSTPSEPAVNLPPPHKGIPAFIHAEQTAARTKYLEGMCQRYSTVMLPIGPAEGFSLQAIFQPLKLRRDPLAAEDLAYEERRALLGESRDQNDNLQRAGRGVEQTVILAHHGEDALHKSPQGRMVVLGGPGTGKTTLLMALVGNQARKALTDANMSIPVFLSLPDLAHSGKPLQDYLLSLTKDLRVDDRYAHILWKAIEDGRAFICLDSLDEVTPRQRPEMIRLVNDLASRPGNIWVVGSRFTEYKGGQFKRGQFAEWELQSMSHDLRLQLAHRLLPELHRLLPGKEGLAEDEPAAFVHTLALHDRVAAWGENPLLFSLAAVVFVRTGALPTSVAALYQQVTDAILETREQGPTRRKMLRRVVADLALQLYQTKGRTFTREDIVMLLPTIRQRQLENWSTEEMTNGIVTSGILDVVAQETYGFRHQTFQEYLAAVELAQRLVSQHQAIRDAGWSFAWSKRTYSRWTGILRLMVGVLVQNHRKEGARQARRWLHELAEQRARPEGDPGDLGLTLALESLIEVPGAKMGTWTEVGGEEETVEIVTLWIAALLSDVGRTHLMQPSPTWKVNCLHLSEQAARVAVEQLMRPLNDTDARVRHAATRVLGMLGEHLPKVAVEQLMRPLNDTDARVRQEAVDALGMLGEHLPVEPILAALEDKHVGVRTAATHVLQDVGERVPVEYLLTALGNEDHIVRGTAENMLVNRREHAPVEQLMQMLASEEWRTRASAAKVLAQLKVRVPVEPFLADLNEKDQQRRREALQVLAELGEEAPLLVALGNKDSDVRRAAIRALGVHIPIETLLAVLSDKDSHVRWQAIQALGVHIPIETLLTALGDKDITVRCAALQVLGELGKRAPIEPLVAALHDKEMSVRLSAVRALVQLGEDPPVEPIVLALQDENVRSLALEALGRLEEHAPVKVWMTALYSEDLSVWSAAIHALWKRGERTEVESLLTTSSAYTHFGWIRVAAVQVLGKLGEYAPVEPLVAALQDKQAYLRAAAAWALWRLGERAPIEPLVAALQDEHWHVRSSVVQTLGKLGERAPVEPLMAALNDEDESVRAGAMLALQHLGKLPFSAGMVGYSALRSSGFSSGGRRVVEENWGCSKSMDKPHRLSVFEGSRSEYFSGQGTQDGEQMGEHTPVERLLRALGDEDQYVRMEAEKILVHRAEQGHLEPLLKALPDQDVFVRATIVQALGKSGASAPVELLVSVLKEEHQQVRAAAARALGQLGERAPVEPLVAALQDEDDYVRRLALLALEQLGERVPIEPLVAALQDEDGWVRAAAARALGQLGERAPVEPLVAALQNKHGQVRQIAATALGQLGQYTPVEPLVAALGDSEEGVRDAAAQTLQQTHPDALLEVTTEAIAILQGQGSGTVLGSIAQGFIADTIRRLEEPSSVLLEKLAHLLDWPHWEVRMKAAQALGNLRRNIPDVAIRRLLELRHDPQSRVVRLAANDALAELLSLETGIEDD